MVHGYVMVLKKSGPALRQGGIGQGKTGRGRTRGWASKPVVLDALDQRFRKSRLNPSVLLSPQDLAKVDVIELVGGLHLLVGTTAVLATAPHAHTAAHKGALILGTARGQRRREHDRQGTSPGHGFKLHGKTLSLDGKEREGREERTEAM